MLLKIFQRKKIDTVVNKSNPLVHKERADNPDAGT
jgi:hypothetical protein